QKPAPTAFTRNVGGALSPILARVASGGGAGARECRPHLRRRRGGRWPRGVGFGGDEGPSLAPVSPTRGTTKKSVGERGKEGGTSLSPLVGAVRPRLFAAQCCFRHQREERVRARGGHGDQLPRQRATANGFRD